MDGLHGLGWCMGVFRRLGSTLLPDRLNSTKGQSIKLEPVPLCRFQQLGSDDSYTGRLCRSLNAFVVITGFLRGDSITLAVGI
jgi:hypothetical protein